MQGIRKDRQKSVKRANYDSIMVKLLSKKIQKFQKTCKKVRKISKLTTDYTDFLDADCADFAEEYSHREQRGWLHGRGVDGFVYTNSQPYSKRA